MKIENLNQDFEEVNENKTLTTSCLKCVFAIKDKKTQTGCAVGKIEKLKNRGINIIEAEDLEENEFYVLEHWCCTYREEVWKTAHEGSDLFEVLEKETYPKIGFVVLIKDNLSEVETTVNSALEQEKFNPSQIVLVNTGEEDYFEVIEKAKELIDGTGVDYKVQEVIGDLTDLEIIDETFLNAKYGFYSVFESGKEIPKDLIKTLHFTLNHNMEKAGYIKGFDGINGMTVSCVLHKFLKGNNGMNLEQKLRDGEEYDEVENHNSLIRTWDELNESAKNYNTNS